MDFHGISQKSEFFMDSAQFHGKCVHEMVNYGGP